MSPVLLSVSVSGRRIPRALLLMVGLVAVVDQLTKAWVIGQIPFGQTREVIPGVLQIARIESYGLLWGLAPAVAVAFAGLLGLIAVGLAIGARRWFYLPAGARRWLWLSAGLVLGGTLSNLVDRGRYGAVTDFLVIAPTHQGNAGLVGQTNLNPVGQTNLADLAITLGVLGLLIVVLRCKLLPKRLESRFSS